MVALIAVVIIAAVAFIGKSATSQFNTWAVGSTPQAKTQERPARRPLTSPDIGAEEVRDRWNERPNENEHPSKAPS